MMTASEICREYRLAKDKDKQIGIIADQCGISRDEIIKVLVDCGEMKTPKEKKKAADKQLSMPKRVGDILCQQMEELDAQISQLEKQLEPLQKEYAEIADFLKQFGAVGG